MKKNKLGYLSFLGILGLLGLATEKTGLYGFFGFFACSYYFNVIPDEMFKQNLLKASAISFLLVLITMISSIVLFSISNNFKFIYGGLLISFSAAIISFTLILAIFDIRERRGQDDDF